MKTAGWTLVCALAACGRIGFDLGPTQHADGGASGGDGSVDPSLVAFYPMEDLVLGTQGESTTDATGNGHTALCDPAKCPSLVPGRDGNAMVFDSVVDRLHTVGAPAADLETTSGFTVAAWFALSEPPSTRACIATKALGTGSANSWALCIETTGQILFYSVAGTQEDYLLTNQTVIPYDWHHAAVRWDGATKSVWLDGEKVMSDTASTDFDGGVINLGADLDDGETVATFVGMIDDVRIYRRALDPAELQQLARP